MHDDFKKRSAWISHAVLPHESAVRAWLRGGGRLQAADVDDLIQEVYAKLSATPSVDHIRDVKAYMFAIAKTLLIDRARRSKIVSIEVVDNFEAFNPVDEAPSAETGLGDRQELRQLARSIASLTPRRREVFVLRKVHQLPQRAVAQRLGITESTVEAHLASALFDLGKILGRPKAQALKRPSDQREPSLTASRPKAVRPPGKREDS